MRTGKDRYTRTKNVLKKRTKPFHKRSNSAGHNLRNLNLGRALTLIGLPLTKAILWFLKTTLHLYHLARSTNPSQLTTSFHQLLLSQLNSSTPQKILKQKLRRRQLYLISHAKKSLSKKIKPPAFLAKAFSNLLTSIKSNFTHWLSARNHFSLPSFPNFPSFTNPLNKLPKLQRPKNLSKFSFNLPQANLPHPPRPTVSFSKLSNLLKPLGSFFRFILITPAQRVVASLQTLFTTLFSIPVSVFNRTNESLQKPRHLRFSYLFPITLIFSSIAASTWFYFAIIKDLPNPSELAKNQPVLTTKIYDRNGILLYKIYKNENRSLVPLSDIPPHLIQATIAIEDQDFYSHSGFSVRGIARAFKANLTDDTLQGGSTITQQLIKNTLLTPERTFTRKTKELILSFLTEFYYSKDEILTMYFNQVPYGGTAYGVQEASRMYFDKDVTDLNLSEAAFLAGLPAAPTRFSPYGPYPERATARQHTVLRRMIEDGYITSHQAESAIKEPIALAPQSDSILAPHFVMYVRDQLAEKFGQRRVEQGGLEVTTTLDLTLQNQVEQIVRAEIDTLQNLNVTNGAALVTNPQTGEILAMVGSRNYFDSQNDGQVNVTLRPRQPGSSIKPINYALALERGLTPATIIPDTPICFNIAGQPPYCPKNYDGQYHGRVTLRSALANSYNIPAVKILSQFGVKEMIAKGELMGISTWDDPSRFGLSLTLGGGEVTMVDMATAYGVFANNGLRVDPTPFLEVKSYNQQILDHTSCTSSNCQPKRVLDPRVAYQITDILSDNQARSGAFGTHSVLHIPGQQVAVKTGTTNNLRDNWTFGYTKDRLVAVWVGNNDNTSMSYIASGITGASPIWNKITTSLLDAQSPHTFAPPNNLAKVKVCTITGQLACNGCPSKEEYFLPGTEPQTHCSPEQIANILNPTPPTEPQQTANN